MVNSYSSQTMYPQYPNSMQEISQRKERFVPPFTTAMVTIGAIGGGIAGYRKNPYIANDSAVMDSFAKKVYEKQLSKAPEESKELYRQAKTCLKKLDKIKTVEQLHNLKAENPRVMLNSLENITEANLAENLRTIKASINSTVSSWYQDAKNLILSAWDAPSKKFIKPEAMDETFFNSIKEATNGMKLKNMGKFALIVGATGALISFIPALITQYRTHEKNITQQM